MSQPTLPASAASEASQSRELPMLALDPNTLGDLTADLDREWLVTNSLGGYAMGSICGATTRAYHGLLVAATRPPVDRVVLVAKVDEVVTLPGGRAHALGTNEWADGSIEPQGYRRLAGFTFEGLVPRITYRLDGGATLDKRIWMEHGHNLTFVQYTYQAPAGSASVMLSLTPFCLDRDHHSTTTGSPDWHFLVEVERDRHNVCAVRAFPDALPCLLVAGPEATFTPSGEWYWHVYHRTEHARGLPDTEDVYVPGAFTLPLASSATATLVLNAGAELPPHLAGLGGSEHERLAADALERERNRCAVLLDRAGPSLRADPLAARLTMAADQFHVARPAVDEAVASKDGVTIIAGYPWFTDWGRDTMIALPGLTLVTGRHSEARALLRTFAGYVDHGLMPNRFSDNATAIPAFGVPHATAEYNTADATLWYFTALGRYLEATGDGDLLAELFPVLDDIIAWHVRGTRYGIGVDVADGLLRAGAPGVQLTWMDAKVDDWVVTPRWGKAVEINALWYAALVRMSAWARELARDATSYDRLREAVRSTFLPRFWYPAGGYLYDVVDVEGQAGAVDWSLRPNQLVALALAPELVPAEQARAVLAIVEHELLAPVGLRTLAPSDPRFIGTYGGDRWARDGAYHQGTVWPWLLGVYADACRNVHGSDDRLPALLAPFADHLLTTGIGTISEVTSGAPPFQPGGCIAQAWSVAEVLRLTARRLRS